ncbi:MAG: UDP-N-acetylglucosamine 1-carboxyvinyltransferase [Elusimicrobia bacterium RIFOXYD2_FULL_34_15]|nr:MAG: UDP-N-acetylglucosamine 1-carboxyvinyltransferase [Elusimicrobia bacterium RIFOXYD2_FULL_34_15]
MDKIIINGGKKLKGEVKISGSKNAALPILIATLLTDDKCTIKNVPDLEDINTVIALLRHLGKKIHRKEDIITVSADKNIRSDAPYELVCKMRASVLVAGPLLARFKKADISLPGGCAIGLRPINIHLDGFKRLGAKYKINKGDVFLKASKLKASKIILDFPSVGATENLLMTSTLVEGETIIENAAIEPEIADLVNFLINCGAKISGIGTSKLKVFGVKKLKGCTYTVMSDRIETGTYIISSAITNGDIKIIGSIMEHNESLIEKIRVAGAKVSRKNGSLKIKGSGKIKSIDVETQVFPGFPTDLQPLWMTLMTVSRGESVITETVFENRLRTVAELIRMGADIKIKGSSAFVKGVKNLTGTKVVASDLRSAAALILAGLAAKGKTEITGLEHLYRGYENIVGKLKNLGADIKLIKKQRVMSNG